MHDNSFIETSCNAITYYTRLYSQLHIHTVLVWLPTPSSNGSNNTLRDIVNFYTFPSFFILLLCMMWLLTIFYERLFFDIPIIFQV
jgi:hypothetical protein